MDKPVVMVSSTFYDLRYVRAELTTFIQEDVGYEPMLSELTSFPIDPDMDTIENCRRRVEDSADILVLVVGGRYGFVDTKAGKSITNLEYIEARNKGIPIYVFIEKGVLAVYDLWLHNKSGDYSSIVDTVKLFDLIEQIRLKDKVWTFPFEKASDIVATLRAQFAYLFRDALEARKKLHGIGLPMWIDRLSTPALRIMLEKPKAWEYLLFAQTWMDETALYEEKRFEYESNLILNSAETVTKETTPEWIQTRMHELISFTQSANRLINESVQKAFGPAGVAGNAFEIVRVAKKLGEIYEAYLDWVERVRSAYVVEPFDAVIKEMEKFPHQIIAQMGKFPEEMRARIESAVDVAKDGAVDIGAMTLKFEMNNEDEFEKAMALAIEKLGMKDV